MARWVHRRDREQRLELVPFQAPDLEERFPSLSRERCREELHLIDERDEIFMGAAAARESLARLPGAMLLTLPFRIPGGMWLANHTYRLVASNRAWLSRW
ncbi:MAG: thiol-disulfide oxidoreductase DCC family protein, partial [Candidatus Methylomirabilales bacterium]